MTSKSRILAIAAAGFAATVLTLAESDAATVRLYREGAVPDPAVVAAILGKPQKSRFRGLNPQGTAPLPADGGETLSEEEIRSNAQAAVSAWQAKVGDRPEAQTPTADGMRPTATVVAAAAQTRPADPVRPEVSDSAARPSAPTRVQPEPAGRSDDPGRPAPGAGRQSRATVLAVLVKFANDSARLSPDSKAPLDAIAAGIRMAGFERKIMVEGHANATGSAPHNARLSQSRADAVKQYLVEKHGIPADLLMTQGFGSTMPLNRQNPAAGENRRVQFRAMEG